MSSLEVINQISEFKDGEFCIAYHKMIVKDAINLDEKELIHMARPQSCYENTKYLTLGSFIVYPVLYLIGHFLF